MWKVPLFKLNYSELENSAVNKVLNSQWLSMGENTNTLEKSFEKYIGNDVKAIAVSSGTAALHLSMKAIGIKKGDEIIVPSLSFIAQINIIENLGAVPVLLDCKSVNDWNMDLSQIKKKINNKTRAIIILHYAGYPCEVSEELRIFCSNKNILIIEDAAHAPGAEINKIKCGAIGDMACFSFFSNKNISAGEGGLITVKDTELANKLKMLRSHGMTSMSLDKIKGRSSGYDVVESGLNYRIDEIRSALAIEQLKKLDESNKKRKKNVEIYINLLHKTSLCIPFLKNINFNKSSYHIFPILLPEKINRLNFMEKMKEKGIQTSIHYPPFWKFTKYKDFFDKNDYPICDKITKQQVTLPLYPSMTEENIFYVCNNIKDLI